MKSLLNKMLLLLTLGVAGSAFAQYYPNDGYNGNNNNYGYEYYNDDYDYPDDYYYEFPDDYYDDGYYRNYYNDYRNSIISINWNRFFVEYRLSPWQINEIRLLNNRFSSYYYWNRYYRMNPDRWYYDRFYALERILGARIYVVFYQRYYHNYNPIVYFQNYRRDHYHRDHYVTPRYRNIDVSHFRKEGFRDNYRSNGNYRNNDGFRTDNNHPKNNGGFRDNGNNQPKNLGNNNSSDMPRNNGGFRGSENNQPKNNGGNRDNGGFRKENSNEGNRSNSSDKGNRGGGFRN